jgi:hypothetical protein
MSWIAPQVIPTDESFGADERGMLEGILERQRATLPCKCAGLSGAAGGSAIEPVLAWARASSGRKPGSVPAAGKLVELGHRIETGADVANWPAHPRW